MVAAKDSGSSYRIQIEERLLAHKWLVSIACAVAAARAVRSPSVAGLRMRTPAHGLLGRVGISVNAARPDGVYREWFQGWDEVPEWRSDDAGCPPAAEDRTDEPVHPLHKSFPNKGWGRFAPRNRRFIIYGSARRTTRAKGTRSPSKLRPVRRAPNAPPRPVAAHANRAPTRTRKGWWPGGTFAAAGGAAISMGLGPPQEMSWWAIRDSRELYALYLPAVVASAFGVATDLDPRDLKTPRTRADAVRPPRLSCHFVIQLFTNLAVFLGFTTWRCEHHNADDAPSTGLQKSEPDCGGYRRRRVEWMSGFRGWCAGDHGSFSRNRPTFTATSVWVAGDDRPCWLHRGDEPAAPPSSRRRVDGVEVDAAFGMKAP